MRFFSSLVRPDESTGAVMRWVHRIWVFFWLTVLGAGIGLLSLYLTAHSYASIDATALLQSYFKIPLLVMMNLLAPILLVYLGFFLFARPWAAYLLSALPFFTLALASYYKVQLRGDPVLATDLRLIRTAGGIMGNYTFEISAPVIVVLEGFVLMLALSCLMLRKERMKPRSRLAGIMLMLSVTLACYFELYTSSSIYKETANNDLISPWSAVEVYISRGTTYPFLHSVQDMFPEPPEGYRESEAKQILEQYADADIPDDQKITVVGIMLEAFSDLSDFPQLNEISAVRNLYEPLHGSSRAAASRATSSRISSPAARRTPNGASSRGTASTRSSVARSIPTSATSRIRATTRSTAIPATRGSTTAATSTNTLALTSASLTNRASATSSPSRTRSSSPTPCSSTTS